MELNEKWNKIVEIVNRNKGSQEQMVQLAWESIFSELFGYSRLDGDIDSQRPVKMGVSTKYPDIIIKNGNEDLFIVELKRPILHEGQSQLFSYLNQLRMDLGLLICDKLYVYNYDCLSKEGDYSFIEIPFTNDNPNGIKLLDLLCKENFDKNKVKDFIAEYAQAKDDIKIIREKISSELIKNLLIQHFEKDFSKETIEQALSEYNFNYSTHNSGMTSYTVAPNVSSITSRTSDGPEVILMIGEEVVSSKEFKDRLLITKSATRFWYYNDKEEPEVDTWNAYSFRPDSNLMGNIHSTKYRYWKTSGLKKIVCAIKDC